MHYRILAATIAAYAATAELRFRSDHRGWDGSGGCTEAPQDYTVLALALMGAVFLVSTILFARASDGRWRLATSAHAGAAALLGTLLGVAWYEIRMTRQRQCSELDFCFYCSDPWYLTETFAAFVFAGLAAVLSIGVGAVGCLGLRSKESLGVPVTARQANS